MRFFYDPTYILIIPAIILSMYAQNKVKTTYVRYNKIRSMKGITGLQTVQRLLSINGLNHIKIELISGRLTDHFDPRNNVLRLSKGICYGNSIVAVGVAAHEVGHALQHNKGYIPIKIRNAIVPIANFGSKFSWVILLAGMILSNKYFVDFGIYLFIAIVVFQILTLPVEIDASNRAIRQLIYCGIIYEEEKKPVKKILFAAALTYVAAVFMAVMQLLRLLSIAGRFRDRN